MNRKGQLTIFIILALVILGGVVLFFSLQKGLIQQPFNPDADRVKNSVQNCIEKEGFDAIYQIGQNGGYSSKANPSTDSGIPYYFYNNRNYMPSKEKIETEISNALDIRLDSCKNLSRTFTDLNVTFGNPSSQASVQDEKVILNANYPVRVAKGEDVSLIKSFKVEVPVRLGFVYNSISKFIQISNGNGLCLSCINDISQKDNLNVEITIIFAFRDETTSTSAGFFELNFANKYG